MSRWATNPVNGVVLAELPGDRALITGRPAAVAETLTAAARHGRLTHVSDPVPAGPGQIAVTCRVLPAAARPVAARRPRWLVATAVGVALAVLGGAAWLVITVVQTLIANAAMVLAGIVVAAALVAPWRKRRRHCPGC